MKVGDLVRYVFAQSRQVGIITAIHTVYGGNLYAVQWADGSKENHSSGFLEIVC